MQGTKFLIDDEDCEIDVFDVELTGLLSEISFPPIEQNTSERIVAVESRSPLTWSFVRLSAPVLNRKNREDTWH